MSSKNLIGKIYKPDLLGWIIRDFYAYGLFFGIFAVWLIFVNPLWAIILTLIAVVLLAFDLIGYFFTSYQLTKEGLLFKRGYVSRTQQLIVYSKIQNVDETQTFLWRILKLADLGMSTMAAEGGILLGPLKESEAHEIKEFILSKKGKVSSAKKEPLLSVDTDKKSMPYPINPLRKAILQTVIIAFLILVVVPAIVALFAYTSSGGAYIKAFNETFSSFLGAILVGAYLGIGYIYIYLVVLISFFGSAVIKKIAFSYAIEKDRIRLQYKFLSRQTINLQFAKIRNLIIKERLEQRILRLATLFTETGGEVDYGEEEGKHAAKLGNWIPDLKKADAFALHDIFLKAIGIKNTKVTYLRQRYPLQQIKPLKKTVRMLFYFIVCLLPIALIVGIFSKSQFWFILKLFSDITLAALIIKLFYEVLYFRNYYYAENEEFITLRKGALSRQMLTMPYKKVQHVIVDQDAFDRIFGLYDVHMSSAGSSKMVLHIDGLNKEDAEALKKIFMSRVGLHKGTVKYNAVVNKEPARFSAKSKIGYGSLIAVSILIILITIFY